MARPTMLSVNDGVLFCLQSFSDIPRLMGDARDVARLLGNFGDALAPFLEPLEELLGQGDEARPVSDSVTCFSIVFFRD